MITIDPMDDEVVQKKKPERSITSRERRSPRQHAASAQKNHETKRHSRLLALALRLLRGGTGEEGTDG